MFLLWSRRRSFSCVVGDTLEYGFWIISYENIPECSFWFSLLCSRRWIVFLLWSRRYLMIQFMQVFLVKHSSHLLREFTMNIILGHLAIRLRTVGHSEKKSKTWSIQRLLCSHQIRMGTSFLSEHQDGWKSSESISPNGFKPPQQWQSFRFLYCIIICSFQLFV